MIIIENECFECGSTDGIENHHIVPRSLGGKNTIPLCFKCHAIAHGNSNIRKSNHSELIKEGIRKRMQDGYKNGRPFKEESALRCTIIIRLTPSERNTIERQAHESGTTISDFIRSLLKEITANSIH